MSPENNIHSSAQDPDKSITNEISVKLRPVRYIRTEATKEMLAAAEDYEKKFGIRFDTLTYFSKMLLNDLHRTKGEVAEIPDNMIIASRSNKTILADIEVLSQVANLDSPSTEQRARYFSALKSVYSKLPSRPDEATQDVSTLFVGIEREGRILAESMGWLPTSHSFHPHAKRVPYGKGLLIGLSEFPQIRAYARCFIIDGAIASGATIISVIEKLRPMISSFYIYSIHSPYQGLLAIGRYGKSEELKISITVGHATTGINAKFYAVDPTDPTRVVVGDLGDTISDLNT